MTDTGEARAIAIIGIGCRFPGIRGPQAFWQALVSRDCTVRGLPAGRRSAHPDQGSPMGGYLDRIDAFDAGFFGVSPREAVRMDPQQRLLLETTWEAFEDAGVPIDKLQGRPVGVFVGGQAGEHWEHIAHELKDIHSVVGSGLRSMSSGRVAYAFDLAGPAVSVDTACSSSLVAAHMAVQSLRSGESELAVAAGTNIILNPEITGIMTASEMLSREGLCRFGSRLADGFARSEGVAAVILKPLAAALSDGDDVHAVILGSAVQSDGQSSGYLVTPSVDGQVRTLRAAYRDANVDPLDVAYVEAHGTGTRAGDPVELEAIATILGHGRAPDQPCLVGSVKTNIGHTEGTAGIAGMIKAALCLRNGVIPASLHADDLRSDIPWHEWRVRLLRDNCPWPNPGAPAIAGVSSTGLSGTNAHIVLAKAAAVPARPPRGRVPGLLLPLSARSPQALRELAARFSESLSIGGDDPADVCFSAGTRRTHHEHRAALVGESGPDLSAAAKALASDQPGGYVSGAREASSERRLAFVCSGQGSQWTAMGSGLVGAYPAFTSAIDECDGAIKDEAGWSVAEVLRGVPVERLPIERIQPTLFTMQVALARLWRSWGVVPDVVVGHSMGEVAAAHVAGGLSLRDAVSVICRRSRLLSRFCGQGGMATIGLPYSDALTEIEGVSDRVSVAAVNGPQTTVISGDADAIGTVCERLEQRSVFCQQVSVDVAAHSPILSGLRTELERMLQDIEPTTPDLPMFSTVDAALVGSGLLGPDYWFRNLREPVQFWPVVREVAEADAVTFLEISPHPVLLTPLAEALGDPALVVPSLRRGKPEAAAMLHSAAQLYVAGHDLDWPSMSAPNAQFTRMPLYPFQSESFWHEARQPSAGDPPDLAGAQGALLGPVWPTSDPTTAVWQGVLDVAKHSYLRDHQVDNEIIFPGVAYLELALEAAVRQLNGEYVTLSQIEFARALFLTEDAPPVLRMTLHAPDSIGRHRFIVASRAGQDDWVTHATGFVSAHGTLDSTVTTDVEAVKRRCRAIPPMDFYSRLAKAGNIWSGDFRTIVELHVGEREALTHVALPLGMDRTGFRVHPVVLDGWAQSIIAAAPDFGLPEDERVEAASVGGGFGTLTMNRKAFDVNAAWCLATHTGSDHTGYRGDVVVVDDSGDIIAHLEQAYIRHLVSRSTARAHTPPDPPDGLHQVTWQPASPPAAPARVTGRFLVIPDTGGIAHTLARQLTDHGVQCTIAQESDDIDGALTDVAGVIDLTATDATSLEQQTKTCERVARLCASLTRAGAPASLTLVTVGAQLVRQSTINPYQTPLWGLGRSIIGELPSLECKLVDLDPADPSSQLAALIDELARGDGEDQIALRAGQRLVPRLRAVNLPHAHEAHAQPHAGPRRLTTAGAEPDTFRFEPCDRRAPDPGEVEIRASHASLQLKDLLISRGVLNQSNIASTEYGYDFAGVITAVGNRVPWLRVGDQVVAVSTQGIGDYIYTPAALVHRYPSGLTAAEAATVPSAFLTAHLALVQNAHVRAGETVLIHTGASSVGLAAIQVARHRGAHVIATAGSEAKRSLLRHLGVSVVADSRSDAYVDAVNVATNGEGVDVVLNTLAGETRMAAMELLKPHGRWIELAKTDIVGGGSIALAPFARALSFHVVDLGGLCIAQPETTGETLADIYRLLADGTYTPLPYHAFAADQVQVGYQQVAAGQHPGRVLITLDSPEPTRTSDPFGGAGIRPGVGYLVTGGLGGIGLELTRWLIEEGATDLLLTGRRPLSDPAMSTQRQALAALSRRVNVRYENADSSDEAAMRQLLERWRHRGAPPIRGVFHAAGVFEYVEVADISLAELNRNMAGKGYGAQVLDALFPGDELDLFVLFSSGSAVIPSPMLGPYAAANAYLDALAWQRRSRGAAATSINWGFWAEVGMAARYTRDSGHNPVPAGMRGFTTSDGMATLKRILGTGVNQAIMMPTDWTTWARSHPAVAASPFFADVISPPQGLAGRGLPPPAERHAQLEAGLTPTPQSTSSPAASTPADQPPAADQLELVKTVVGGVLGLSPDRVKVTQPLNQQGLDSLMAAEVRARIRAETGHDIPLVKILRGATAASIAALISARPEEPR